MKKKLIPCIYLKNRKLVAGFKKNTVITEDPVSFCVDLAIKGADMLIIFDLSSDDREHEENLNVIRDIKRSTDIPLIGAGNIKRSEDVKKLKYAGCSHIALNLQKPGNVALIPEVSKRFSKDCIFVCADIDAQILDNADLIREYCTGVIFLNDSIDSEYKDMSIYPVVNSDNGYMEKIRSLFSNPSVAGVSGDIVNQNAENMLKDKITLRRSGFDTEVFEPAFSFDDLKTLPDGLVPVVVQEYDTDQVLMVAYMNREAYERTVSTLVMNYYSRSRGELWLKGETSGHYQYVKELYADCDMDTILAKVVQTGAACHTGAHSCFFNEIIKKDDRDALNPMKVFEEVFSIIKDRKENPKEGSYTNYLFDKGIDKILKKVGEEATEIVIAAKNPEKEEVKYEMADFLYHMMVLMAQCGLEWSDITTELKNR
ncbi:MAG: bifunctional phosphoribosyl-AMP cyclohydrolase/phosphoribosyl-ATP diphosphatase HisIE [Lachnospiraceae bacterium]|nr:bifunctional phosphoribosyl-AMP cyclohydrolase/phosphoribosyl-ATP diphosphatase HisIE [Lachnospiraceae bacterium]